MTHTPAFGRRIAVLKVALGFAIVFWSRPLSAQRALDVERLVPALDDSGFIGIQGTRTPGPFRFNVSLWGAYTHNPLMLTAADGSRSAVIDDRIHSHVMAQLGIGGRLAFAVDVPLVVYQSGNTGSLDAAGLTSTALGDPRLVGRVRVFGSDSAEDPDENEGLGVALQVASTLPLGDRESFASERGVRTDVQLLSDFHLFGAGAGIMLGFRHRFDAFGVLGERVRDELHAGLGLEVPIPVEWNLSGLIEVRAITDAGAPFASSFTTAVDGDVGVRFRTGDLALTAAVGTGFTDAYGSPSFRGLLGASFAPHVHDADGDGIPDDKDQCPHLPEDFDGFQDRDGCLDPDDDNDLVPDEDDRCPREAAVEGKDNDEDGCTDPVADADQDGIPDGKDRCINEAEDKDGYQDHDGCPDPDNDGDGVTDAQDKCPREVEDKDGYQDDDGCPDPDNDRDGVLDVNDKCPREAEDKDGYQDDDGCPDPDNDRDGVLDVNDKCPNQAETINGIDDDDGCADAGGVRSWRSKTSEALHTLTAMVPLDEKGAPKKPATLEQLAHHVIAEWGRPCVVHTPKGDSRFAEAVRTALSKQGLAATRCEYSDDEPRKGSRLRVVFDRATATSGATSIDPLPPSK